MERCLGFTSQQIRRLYLRFQELENKDPPTGFLTRDDLLHVPEVALNPLGERLVDVLIEDYGEITTTIPKKTPYSIDSSPR